MTYDHPLPDTARTIHHNHGTRDIKAPGICPACDQDHAKPVVTAPEAIASPGESFTLVVDIRDTETNTLDRVEIRVSGYTSPAAAVRALYNLGQEGYLANLYQALEGNGVEDDD